MLGCIQPMSSPMMNRMFGFFSSAVAGDGRAAAVAIAMGTAAQSSRFNKALIPDLPRFTLRIPAGPIGLRGKSSTTSGFRPCQSPAFFVPLALLEQELSSPGVSTDRSIHAVSRSSVCPQEHGMPYELSTFALTVDHPILGTETASA